MTTSPILMAAGLSVGYRRRRRAQPILSGLDLVVSPGEMVCLLGENGVGKSTLLRTLAGLQKPLAGRVEINGVDIARIRSTDRARSIGVVLSERIGVGALRARQMVALGRYAYSNWAGRFTDADERAVDRAIESVGAMHLADRDCRELSDGERQRFNLARVLAQEPELIVLDEPTAFLDIASRVELMALLRRLARDQDIGVIASTHDIDLALRNADTAWLLSPTRSLHCGAPEDLISAGVVAEAFSAGRLELDPVSLSFRPVPIAGQTVTITGSASGRRLAASVLQREGYRPTTDSTFVVEVTDDAGRWQVIYQGAAISGTSYAALAAFVRRAAPTVREPDANSIKLATKKG